MYCIYIYICISGYFQTTFSKGFTVILALGEAALLLQGAVGLERAYRTRASTGLGTLIAADASIPYSKVPEA